MFKKKKIISTLLVSLAIASCTVYPNGLIGPAPVMVGPAPAYPSPYVQPGPVVNPQAYPYNTGVYTYPAIVDYSILPTWGFIGWYGGVYYNNVYWYAHPYNSWRGRGWSGWHEHGGGYGHGGNYHGGYHGYNGGGGEYGGYHGGNYGHYNSSPYHGSGGGFYGGHTGGGFHGNVGSGHMGGGHKK